MKIGGPPLPPVLPAPRQDTLTRFPDAPRDDAITFGFDEPGVFGPQRHHRPATPDREVRPESSWPAPDGRDKSPEPHAASPPRPGPTREPEPLVASPPRPDVAPAPPLEVSPPPRPEASPPPVKPDRPPVARGPAGPRNHSKPLPADAAQQPVEFLPAPAVDDLPACADGSADIGTREALTSAALKLRLLERDGRVVVAAIAPPLDGEGRVLLRRLAREILAGHGLGLADFHLNGVPLEADFSRMTGVSHGPRPR